MIDCQKVGLDRDLNPGPRAPEARIIPLDHQATYDGSVSYQVVKKSEFHCFVRL